MKALVIGGSGFVGKEIVKVLENTGCDVTIFGLHPPRYRTNAPFVLGSILDLKAMENLESGDYDIVFHLAGVLGTSLLFSNVRKAETINVIGTINVLEMMKDGGVVIQPNLLGDWSNPYMISKRTAERYGLMYGKNYPVKYISVRPSDIFGPGQSMEHGKAVPTFITQALRQEPLTIYGDGCYNMRLIFVRDIAKIIVHIASQAADMPSVIDVGSLQEENHISVRNLAEKIIRMTVSTSTVEHHPMRRGQPKGLVDYNVDLDQSKLMFTKAGVKETPLDIGLQETIDYYKAEIGYDLAR